MMKGVAFLNIYDEDIYLRCKELTNNYEDNTNDDDYKNYIMNNLKVEFSSYYSELSDIYKARGIYADQVWDIYNSHNLYAINNAKGVLKENRDDVIEALLYTLGKDDIEVVKHKKSDLRKKEKRIIASLNGLQIGVTKTKDKEELKKKKEDIISQTNDLNKISNEINFYDSIISNTEVIELGDRKLQKTSNYLCATIIRNCFAHCDRIHITGRDKSGETLITLTDYDNDGKISGVVETNLTSLINFLSHDIFKKEMNKQILTTSEKVYKK